MKSDLVKIDKFTTSYPALYECFGAVVMFESDECGTVVVGTENFPLGDYSDSLKIERCTRLPSGSQIILTQE